MTFDDNNGYSFVITRFGSGLMVTHFGRARFFATAADARWAIQARCTSQSNRW